MSYGQTMPDSIDFAQGSQLKARSPSALGIGAASFASETVFGDGNGIYLGTSLGSETGMKRAKI